VEVLSQLYLLMRRAVCRSKSLYSEGILRQCSIRIGKFRWGVAKSVVLSPGPGIHLTIELLLLDPMMGRYSSGKSRKALPCMVTPRSPQTLLQLVD